MLNALLETIGTLGILASLVAQFAKPAADAMACDGIRPDDPADPALSDQDRDAP